MSHVTFATKSVKSYINRARHMIYLEMCPMYNELDLIHKINI